MGSPRALPCRLFVMSHSDDGSEFSIVVKPKKVFYLSVLNPFSLRESNHFLKNLLKKSINLSLILHGSMMKTLLTLKTL